MPGRIGTLAFAHRVWLPVADLASKYGIVTGEGFSNRDFSLTTFTICIYQYVLLVRYSDVDAE
jgi:hypothetical protein